MTEGHKRVTHNTAWDPTRRWRAESSDDLKRGSEVVFRACHLIQAAAQRHPDSEHLIRLLAENPDQPFDHDYLNRKSAGSSECTVDVIVEWINKHASALGYVPLVQRSEAGFLIDSSTSEVVNEAFQEISRQHPA